MWLRIWNLIVKEFIQFGRDRFFAAFMLLFPVTQLVMLAQATGSGVTHLPTAVWDQSRSALSRSLITALDVTEELDVRYFPASLEEANELIASGKASVVVIIPADFDQAFMRAARPAQIQVMADGSNTMVSGVGVSAAEGVISDFVQRQQLGSAQINVVPIELRTSVHYNPALNVQYHTVPAQAGFIIYQVTLAVAATVLARERELGTLEQLAVTPLRRLELITGKAILPAMLGMLNFWLMMAVMIYGFRIPMRGSFVLLTVATLLFIAVEVGWGMMISAISRTQQQAILMVFIIAMTDVSLSGYIVPVKNMPSFLQSISVASAIRHYLTLLRAVMLKAADWAAVWPDLAALAGLAVAVGTISLLLTQDRLD